MRTIWPFLSIGGGGQGLLLKRLVGRPFSEILGVMNSAPIFGNSNLKPSALSAPAIEQERQI